MCSMVTQCVSEMCSLRLRIPSDSETHRSEKKKLTSCMCVDGRHNCFSLLTRSQLIVIVLQKQIVPRTCRPVRVIYENEERLLTLSDSLQYRFDCASR